ncbi:hypothetical protein MKW92_027492 [Papaver armeniacum]|nr:hypothetical protein MKW92_027492 [Papaver armeniacum]
MMLLISELILKKKKKKKNQKVFDNLLFGMCGHGNLSHIDYNRSWDFIQYICILFYAQSISQRHQWSQMFIQSSGEYIGEKALQDTLKVIGAVILGTQEDIMLLDAGLSQTPQ